MLDTETKRRIDSARDILVGKVPDPKSQVEQITIALIYKFMDDMDAESEEFGGKRKFFAGEYAHYGWARLMHAGLGGHEMLNLYAEAISKMPENPGIPLLFRDIFKNAYLPYRDPETLKSFLKIIDEFSYDHSERLGDAFEYLLSVLGSQGDAGQFRTPRHIIDFMVALLDPQKTDTVLDPACGTAGFLISSWNHILKANTDANGHSKLTPDERGRLARNFIGYDISPDMVRLSLVNLYLHGFADPHIVEYDSLTSQERWNETADVVLANPPFMSPKGGIKPHNRFSVQSKRSEVLFVDYMAEHLSANGRAAIIVPEGVIFQSQTAYKKLRKMLVDEALVAVVSLPAGLFQPYSGVKTSILILDKSLAKRSNSIGFFKISNDGFGLGAQRRVIDKNDLPQAQEEIGEYLRRLRAGESVEDFEPTLGLIVEKEKVATGGDYNLSGERYREKVNHTSCFSTAALGDLCQLQRGLSYSSAELGDDTNGTPFYNLKSIKRGGAIQRNDFKYFTSEVKSRHYVHPGDVLVALTDLTPTSELIGSPKLVIEPVLAAYSADLGKVVFKDSRLQPHFLYHILRSEHYRAYIVTYSHGANVKHLQTDGFYEFQIPLPPLEMQREIVAEIEGYQKVIDGARVVLDNYRPHISVKTDWPRARLAEICTFSSGGTPSKSNEAYWSGIIPWVSAKDLKADQLYDSTTHVSEAAVAESATQMAPIGSLLILVRGMGLANGVPVCEVMRPCAFNQDLKAVHPDTTLVTSRFLAFALRQQSAQFGKIMETAAHGTLKIGSDDLRQIELPLPPLADQQAIVAEIEAEQALVNANRELIARFEKKIAATLARIWDDSDASSS